MTIDMNELFDESLKEINEKKEMPILKTEEQEIITTPSKSIEDEEIYIDEEDLIEEYEHKWSYQIKERGSDYYYSNHILNVYKNGYKYFAKVGGNAEKPYNVSIELTEDDIILNCTCPCTYPCKHEYAVLLAISEGEYECVELKTPFKEKEMNLQSLIKDIPAEEIKNYLLSPIGKEKVVFEMTAFNENFRKYMPAQKYEFYYNNLYNALILNKDYIEMIENYFDRIRQYISGNNFTESFKITKSIVEAYNDSGKLNFDNYVFEMISKMGMLLRITYRKATNEIIEEIKEWSDKLEKENYYNNYYLEDLILNLK